MIATLLSIAACAWQPTWLDRNRVEQKWLEPVEGLRVAPSAGVIEIDTQTCLTPDRTGERVDYLELFVCSWDSREHESLLATDVMPSDVHAALLLAGARPGSPAVFQRTGEDGQRTRTPASGSALEVTFHWKHDDEPRSVKPWSWIRHADNDERLSPASFIFAGSATSREGYAADAEGTLLSLVVFDVRAGDGRSVGIETIAWADPISHEQAVDDAVWVADWERIPDEGTPVIVRIKVLDERPEKDRPEASPAEEAD